MLVGPNGSGKTNIILFFEFLSHIASEPLGEAVSKCGGAGSIFQKIGIDDFRNSIHARIEGRLVHHKKGRRSVIRYCFEFSVEISKERDSIYYRSQRLRFFDGNKKQGEAHWDLDISTELTEKKTFEININKIDLRKNTFFKGMYFKEPDENLDRDKKISILEEFLKRYADVDTNILFVIPRFHPEVDIIVDDLVGGEAFNVMPSAAREAEDSATPPGIRKDGSGLAATFYALKQLDRDAIGGKRHRWPSPTQMRFSRVYRYPRRLAQVFSPRPHTFRRIVEFVRLANDEIQNLDVHLDHTDNKLKIIATMRDKNGELLLPFSLMSDGTVKWISLISAIFTYRSIFAIEEPENFIHPLMQKEIAAIMRGSSRDRGFKSFVLMTTHSETLLNAATPDEVLVVSMNDGVTQAKRPANREILVEEISRTGFGLGHYYLTGALEDA